METNWKSLALVFMMLSICGADPVSTLGPRAEGRNGVVVSGSVDSATAALEVLRRGGNAADAAVATTLVESVANSDRFCFGGEVAILIYDAPRHVVEAISGVGAAPQLATFECFEKAGGIRGGTAQAAAVPAVLAACVTLLDRYGTMTFSDVAQPMLRMLDGGRTKWHGDLLRTLQGLMEAEKGATDRRLGLRSVADRFHRGPIARDIDTWSQANGGLTIDPRIGENVLESLRQRGHKVNPVNVSGQERTVIVIDPSTGTMSGAGDPEAVPARAAAAF